MDTQSQLNPSTPPPREKRLHWFLWISFGAALIWSLIRPHDLFTWFLETFPAIGGAIFLTVLYPRWKFTPLVYILIWLHTLILLVGGHYTYAEMPLFNWIRDAFGFSRNHYDRLGHFAQGFVPAMIAREILLRKSPLRRGKLLFFLVFCVCMAISALYELLEWGVAEATGSAADAFLGTQGDPWDTQWDMFFALIGSLTAQATLHGIHNAQLVKLSDRTADSHSAQHPQG